MKSTTALRHRVGSLLIVGVETTSLTAIEAAWLRALQPGGLILFRRNVESAAQIHALLQQTALALSQPFFRCIDLEGGTVDRLRDLIGATPSAAEAASTGSPAIFREHGAFIGRALHSLGFNLDLAPVLDLALPAALPVMGTRVVSPDPAQVIAYAREFLAGLAQHGVLGCGKHFPGLGGGALDSHHAMPRIPRTWEQVWQQDLEPYRALASELPLVMVNHAAYPKIEKPLRPASLSRFWIQEVLRGKMRYRGLVISDDMEMGGVLKQAPLEGAAIEAIAAGTDLLEICHRGDRVLITHEALLREAERSPAFARRVNAAAARVWQSTTAADRQSSAAEAALRGGVEKASGDAAAPARQNRQGEGSAMTSRRAGANPLQTMTVAGIMSGTSADGIDVALVRIRPPAGAVSKHVFKLRLLAHVAVPYPAAVRRRVLQAMNGSNESVAELSQLHWRLGQLYADAVEVALQRHPMRLDLIGCHGQTIYHQAEARRTLGGNVACTWQMGEASVIAARLGIPVVSDFRPADLAAGGQGAPLVPLLDYVAFRHPTRNRVLQNLGGIGNLTVVPANARPEDVFAFDTGPANMVIDAIMMECFGKQYDARGMIAARGQVLDRIVREFLSHRFFQSAPPKSAGREEFGREFTARFLARCRQLSTPRRRCRCNRHGVDRRAAFPSRGSNSCNRLWQPRPPISSLPEEARRT